MCGIIGISVKNNEFNDSINNVNKALRLMSHRGPNNQSVKSCTNNLVLGHARLSIIDLKNTSNQPMQTQNERYTLVFNGEIYNFKSLKKDLILKGYNFKTDSDTEVLLNLLVEFGAEAIQKLNGFFAFAFHDKDDDSLLIARDRFGIKPLYFYEDDNQFIFSSVFNSFFAFDIDKTIDSNGLNELFKFTYIPGDLSIFKNVKKAKPGHYYQIINNEIETVKYYEPKVNAINEISYSKAVESVKQKVYDAVETRMIADVPIGSFLSGGLDSSIVSTVAKAFKSDLKTFSVGFDHPFFDESRYANDVVNKIDSDHTSIILTQNDFVQNFDSFLDSIDEPFADSSAFAVYLLSQKTKQSVTVALSGDGADEVFGGYRKYYGEWVIRNSSNSKKNVIKLASKFGSLLPENRSSKIGDINRKLQKLSNGYASNSDERYWNWGAFILKEDRDKLFVKINKFNWSETQIINHNSITDLLINDQKYVLPNDMLTKVDMMSMANSLEVRTPFLDHNLVDFVNDLPDHFKVNKNGRKQILTDAFKSQLPKSVWDRQKKGFEIPLKSWIGQNIDVILESEKFSKNYIEQQGLFDFEFIQTLKKNWKMPNYGDKIYLVWTLIIFQNWWHKHLN